MLKAGSLRLKAKKMVKNYFKTAWRNLMKYKFYAFINIAGLTIGLSVGLLILLWVQNELSYDRFNKKADHIYRLENMVGTGSSRKLWTVTAAPIGYLAKKDIPGVKDFVRVTRDYSSQLFEYNSQVFNEQEKFFVDPSFFSVFDFKIKKGNAANPFPDNHAIVITQSTAQKYFGDKNPIGKVIKTDTASFTVSGVIKDFPRNSSIQGNMFFPMSLLSQRMYGAGISGKNMRNDFGPYQYDTYLLLKKGFSLKGLPARLRQLHLSVKPDDTDIGYLLLPLGKMHLYNADGSDGGIETVRMFIIIALLLLIIACINYINLSTARSLLREQEVSLRKIVGAPRWQLFLQFIIETSVIFLFSILSAFILLYLIIPLFNEISGNELVLNLTDYHLWEVILITIAGTLAISSIYPAILLSSFKPMKALRAKASSQANSAIFRKVLVVIQFAFSIILIIGTITISRQLHYMRSTRLGFNKDNVFAFNMLNLSPHYDAVKAELLRQPGIKNVSWSNARMINNQGQTGNSEWDGKKPGETVMLSPWGIGKDFIPFFELKMVVGHNFSGSPADSAHFILNETALKEMAIKNPIGKKFRLWDVTGTITGVVKDFHFASMRQKIQPAIFYFLPHAEGRIYIKTTGHNASEAVAAAEKEWEKYNSAYPFDYAFLDESYDRLYMSEQRSGIFLDAFTLIAIFISGLGLLGLATYSAQVRTREIGIRKVLGASIGQIGAMLSEDFIKLVFIAILIATPVAWWAAHKWLQDYAYRIHISWWIFLLAGLGAIVVALLTVSFQAIKAAVANPVKSLRTE